MSSTLTSKSAAQGHLAAVEYWVALFGTSLVGVTLFWGGPGVKLGACVGAVLSVLNARALRFFGARIVHSKSVGLLVVLFQLKLGLLAGLIYLALKLLPLQPAALLLGLSALPLGILARGIQYGLRAPSDSDMAPVTDACSDSYREN